MRLVITSDTHGKHHQLGVLNGDVLIHCGDFTNGFQRDPNELENIDGWFHQQEFQHVLCVAGNHDFAAENRVLRGEPVFQNAMFLQDESVMISGLKFYGAPWVPDLQSWAFCLAEDEMRSKWEQIPDDTDVLITHTPPWHTLDRSSDSEMPCGCSHLAARIADLNLKMHCFGHIHASYGRLKRDGVIFLNASAMNSNFEIVNKPFVIDL